MNYANIINDNKEEFRSNFFPDKLGTWKEIIFPHNDNKEPDVHCIDIYKMMNRLDSGDYDIGFPDLVIPFIDIIKNIMMTGKVRSIANFGAITGVWTAPFLKYSIVDKIDVYELRNMDIPHPKISVICEDLTNKPIDNIEPKYDLISCIDSISHSGLGRYSKYIDPNADIKMGKRIVKLLRPNGYLILALTYSKKEEDAGIIFNIQRNYTDYRMGLMTEGLELIDDLTKDVNLHQLRDDVPCERRMFLFQKGEK